MEHETCPKPPFTSTEIEAMRALRACANYFDARRSQMETDFLLLWAARGFLFGVALAACGYAALHQAKIEPAYRAPFYFRAPPVHPLQPVRIFSLPISQQRKNQTFHHRPETNASQHHGSVLAKPTESFF